LPVARPQDSARIDYACGAGRHLAYTPDVALDITDDFSNAPARPHQVRRDGMMRVLAR
jgi:hypothetical protein